MRPGKCLDRISRIKAIEKEFRVAIVARDVLSRRLAEDPSTLTSKGLGQVHFDSFRDNLDSTYLIRLFAEFESGLRNYWKHSRKKMKVVKVSDLIKSIGSREKIDHQERDNVEKVRRYRNALVHEEDSEAQFIEVGEARKSLCIYFGRLPENW